MKLFTILSGGSAEWQQGNVAKQEGGWTYSFANVEQRTLFVFGFKTISWHRLVSYSSRTIGGVT